MHLTHTLLRLQLFLSYSSLQCTLLEYGDQLTLLVELLSLKLYTKINTTRDFLKALATFWCWTNNTTLLATPFP